MVDDGDISTIAALATAPMPSGIAVIRVSGPKTKQALRALFRSRKDPISDPRRLIFGELIDHKTGEIIDHALAVYMPGPHSFTGEDIGEFQFHGSPLLVQKMLRSLFSFGVTPADPGEFTRRAFLNGKMDLIQAEAIAELINSTTDEALKIAGEHLKGKFSSVIEDIGEPLRDILAEIEASIDFPEEGIETKKVEQCAKTIHTAREKIDSLVATHEYGSMVREGFRVLLCGRPNVGKSSLLNLLVGKERAIVTEVSGTTRDVIEEEALLSGIKFVFCDSAGLRDTDDPVEKIGVELAKERIDWADLILFVVDASDSSGDWNKVLDMLRGRGKRIWMVTNKIDLNPNAIATFFCDSSTCAQNFYLSVKTRAGLDQLTAALIEEVSQALPDRSHANHVVTSERQRSCLVRASVALFRAEEAINNKMPAEIYSAEIRLALSALQELIGTTYTEDILGRIFSKFCIGK